MVFEENRTGRDHQTQGRMTVKPETISGRSKGTTITVITLNQDVSSMCLRTNHSVIPLRYVDVIRRSHTSFDVLQESPLDENWTIDGDRNLSEPWTCFTRFPILNETTS